MGNQNNFEYKIHVSIDEKNIHGDVKKILSNFQHEISDNAVNITFNGDMDNLVKQLIDLKKKFPDLDLGKSISFNLAENLRSDAEKGKEIMDGVVTHIINAVNNAASEISNIQQKLVDASVELDKLNRKKIKLGIDEKGVADPTKALKEAERRLSSYKLEKQNTNRIREAYQDVVNIAESTGQKVSDSTKALLGNIKQSLNIDLEKETKVTQTYQQMVDNFELETLKIKNRILELQKDLQSAQTPELQIKGKLADDFMADLQSQIDKIQGDGLGVKVKPKIDKNAKLEVEADVKPKSIDKDNVVYHAGVVSKLNKAETNGRFVGSNRGTGYYGTGHYFVDANTKHELDNNGYYNKLPYTSVDISKYKNLFKADTDKKANDLHNFLNNLTRYTQGSNTYNVDELFSQFEDVFGKSILSIEDFKIKLDSLKSFMEQSSMEDRNDSVSTQFMKSLGYGGVDTRGTRYADTRYGTVIYDLKEESILQANITDELEKQGDMLEKRNYAAGEVWDKNEDARIQGIIDAEQRRKEYLEEYKKLYDVETGDKISDELESAEDRIREIDKIITDCTYSIENAEEETRDFYEMIEETMGLDMTPSDEEFKNEVENKKKSYQERIDELKEERAEIEATLPLLEEKNRLESEIQMAAYEQAKRNVDARHAEVQATHEVQAAVAEVTTVTSAPPDTSGENKIQEELKETGEQAKETAEAIKKVNDSFVSNEKSNNNIDEIKQINEPEQISSINEDKEIQQVHEQDNRTLEQKLEYLKQIKKESEFLGTAEDKRIDMEEKAWDAGGLRPKSEADSLSKIAKYEEHIEHMEVANELIDDFNEKFEKTIVTLKNGEKIEIFNDSDLDGVSLAKKGIKDIEFVLAGTEDEVNNYQQEFQEAEQASTTATDEIKEGLKEVQEQAKETGKTIAEVENKADQLKSDTYNRIVEVEKKHNLSRYYDENSAMVNAQRSAEVALSKGGGTFLVASSASNNLEADIEYAKELYDVLKDVGYAIDEYTVGGETNWALVQQKYASNIVSIDDMCQHMQSLAKQTEGVQEQAEQTGEAIGESVQYVDKLKILEQELSNAEKRFDELTNNPRYLELDKIATNPDSSREQLDSIKSEYFRYDDEITSLLHKQDDLRRQIENLRFDNIVAQIEDATKETDIWYRRVLDVRGVLQETGGFFANSIELAKSYMNPDKHSMVASTIDKSKFLTVDAKGARWNELWDLTKELEQRVVDELGGGIADITVNSERGTTKYIANLAKALGYLGIEIQNVVDVGAYGENRNLVGNIVQVFDESVIQRLYNITDAIKGTRDEIEELQKVGKVKIRLPEQLVMDSDYSDIEKELFEKVYGTDEGRYASDFGIARNSLLGRKIKISKLLSKDQLDKNNKESDELLNQLRFGELEPDEFLKKYENFLNRWQALVEQKANISNTSSVKSQLEKEAEVKRDDVVATNELIDAEKKLREETSKPIVNTAVAESPTTPLPPQVEEALVNDGAKIDEIVEAENKKFGELGTELSTDIPQAIDKKNEALDGEVTKVNEVVDAEIAKFGALETELSETIPQAINTKNEALDSEKNKVDTIVQAEIDKFGQLETKIKTDIPKAIEEKNASLEAERDKVKEVVDAEVEMFGGLEGAVNGVKNAIDGKNNSVDEAKKKGSGKKKSSEKKKSDTDEENSSEESSENTAPLFYENDTLKKYLLGVQDRFNKANLKLGVELDKAAFEAEFKKAADEVAQDFNRMFGTSITGKDVVNAIRNIEKEEAAAAEQAKKDAEDVELEYGKVLADARQAEQELADAQKKKGQEFLKENEEYAETKLINERNESYEKLIATIDEYDKMKKRVLSGEKIFGDSDEAVDKLKEKIEALFSELLNNPTIDNRFNKIIDKYISVEEKANNLEILKTSEGKYGYLGTLTDKYIDAKKNGNDAAANKYKEQFEKTKEFLRTTESYNEKLEREAVDNFTRLNNELEESEKKLYSDLLAKNEKELDDLGKQQQKQGQKFIEEGERYNKAEQEKKTNEVLMERKILYDELIEAIEKYSEMSNRIASGKRIAGDGENEVAILKSNAKTLLSQAMSQGVLTDPQINNAINKYDSVDTEAKRLTTIRKSNEEYEKLTKLVNEYADAKKRVDTGKALEGDVKKVQTLKTEYEALRDSLKNGDLSDLYNEESESRALKRVRGLDAEIKKAQSKSAPKDDSEQKKRIELLNTYTNKLKEQAKYEEQIKALRKNDVSDSSSDITSREEALQAIKNEIAAMGELNLTEEENLNIQNKVAQARRQYAINAQKEKKDTSKQDALNENKQKYIELLKEENKLYLQNDLAKKMGEEPDSNNVTELIKIEEKKKALEEILELEGQAEFIEQENAKASNARSEGEKKNLKAEEALLKRRQNLLQQITQWLKSNPIAERKYGSGLNESIEKLNSSAKLTPKILNEIEKEFKEVKLEATKSGDVGVGFFNVLKQRWQSLAAYIGSFASFYRVTAYVREMINTVKDLDTALTEMRKVSDESVETLKAFQKESFDIAAQVGSTAKVIQDSTADWMRLGESLNEAKESAKDASILLNVSEFESIDEATTALVAMSQAYKDMDKIDIIDKLNNIGNNFSISTDQLATGLQNAAAVLKTQGNDIDKSIALLTAANSIVQDISKASTGIRTIALRIAGTETAKEELEELGESVDDYIVQTQSKTQETIRAYTAVASNLGKGVDVLDANGNLRDTYDILLDISKVYKEIQEEDKKAGTNRAKALVEYIAGKNRSNIAASVLENPDLLEQVYKQSQDSAGSAMEENEKYLDSIEGHIAKLQNQLQKLYYDTIESGFIKGITDILTGLTRVIDKVGLLKTAVIGIFTAIGSKKLG